MKHTKLFTTATLTFALALLSACASSPETQAKIDEFERTIPTCSSDANCQAKWAAARAWAEQNSAFIIRGDSDTRIMATGTRPTDSGLGIVIHRVAANGGFQIVVEAECFSAYGCADLWDVKLDFNRRINAVN